MFGTVSDKTLRERVGRGASLLDNKNPGWAEEVSITSLDLSSLDECILGELYGWFGVGVAKLALSMEDAIQLGFNIKRSDLPVWGRIFCNLRFQLAAPVYKRLDAIWAEEILARRAIAVSNWPTRIRQGAKVADVSARR